MSVLGVLLEGFDEAAHPRGFHGRFKAGDHVTLMHGMFGSVPARVTKVTGGRVHVTSPDSRVSDTSMTHNQAAVKLTPTLSSSRERGAAEVDAQMAAFKRGEVQRPRVRGDGRSGPIAPSAPTFDPVTSLGREGRAARERGASSATTEHADTRDKLASLPRGQRYALHGPQGQVGHVERTAAGWHVVGSSGEPTSHKTPSSAAGAAMRIQRQAASSPHNADVMARNYRGGREVERMNARQSQRATAEAVRARRLAARDALGIPRVRESQSLVLGALLEGH